MKRGMGADQVNKAKLSTQRILEVLQDGEKHRFMELRKKTKMSPTTLTKRLKELEKGIVKKTIDKETVEYPPPVYYQLQDNLNQVNLNTLERDVHNALFIPLENLDLEKGNKKDYEIADYLAYLNFQLYSGILNFLKRYIEDRNEVAFNQSIENYTLETYRQYIDLLKNKMFAASNNGVNIHELIVQTEERISENFKKYCNDSIKEKRKAR